MNFGASLMKKAKEATADEASKSKKSRKLKKPKVNPSATSKEVRKMSTREQSTRRKKKTTLKKAAASPGEPSSIGPSKKPSSGKLKTDAVGADCVFSDHKKKRIQESEKPNEQQKATLNDWINKYMTMGIGGIMEEYDKKIKGQLPKCLTEANRAGFSANAEKNRYGDVVCLEPTRVIIKDGRPGEYIHANYIKTEPLVNHFIATQGPMPGTVVDFWRMIVQEKIRHIFMLCELVEQGKQKCERYWPENAGDKLTFGDFVLTTQDRSTPDSHIILTKICVEFDGKKYNVEHHNWVTWPDRFVPKSLLAVFRLLKYARASRYETSVVHCSAGIGRTGTFIILEYVLQNILSNAKLDLAQCVLDIREMRMSSVQIDIQYVFVVASIGKFASSLGCLTPETEQRFKQFITGYEDYLSKRQAAESKCCMHSKGGEKTPEGAKSAEHTKGLDMASGHTMSCVPTGTDLSAYPMPEGAGTDFKMDAIDPKSVPGVTTAIQPPTTPTSAVAPSTASNANTGDMQNPVASKAKSQIVSAYF